MVQNFSSVSLHTVERKHRAESISLSSTFKTKLLDRLYIIQIGQKHPQTHININGYKWHSLSNGVTLRSQRHFWGHSILCPQTQWYKNRLSRIHTSHNVRQLTTCSRHGQQINKSLSSLGHDIYGTISKQNPCAAFVSLPSLCCSSAQLFCPFSELLQCAGETFSGT